MFGKKRRKELFGTQIEPDCRYCRCNGGKQGNEPVCTLRMKPKKGKCSRYEYDPLRREPKSAPALHTDRYSKEDFSL